MIVIEELRFINIPTTKMEEAIEFYTMFFDFEQTQQGSDFTELSFDTLRVRLWQKEEYTPANFPVFSFILDVDDFTEALQEIEEKQIAIHTGPYEISGGEAVQIQDPSGNLLELFYQD